MSELHALVEKLRTLLKLANTEMDGIMTGTDGGDPFTLVIHLEEAKEVAEKIEDCIAERVTVPNGKN